MSFASFLLNHEIIANDVYELLAIQNHESVIDERIMYFLFDVVGLSTKEIENLITQYYESEQIELILNDSTSLMYSTSLKSEKDLSLEKFRTIATNKKYVSEEYQLDNIFIDAINQLASDIHISPYEKIFEIRYRIDGELRNVKILPISKFSQICVAIKVMAKLDISETRRPQSGHFEKNDTDFRISTHPTIYGENVCIRILSKNKSYIKIENIGFDIKQIAYLKRISQFPNGMIIFCGPTGSGKTTSIYSMLATLDKRSKNIMTLEDPVEYKIHGVKQTEYKQDIMDFATGVRSILRQDPDIILIGEIRDKETAEVAIRASMTGHLVFTTVHSNDSFGAIKRFQDFGISPFLVADNIISIISQRLIRKSKGGRTIISEILHIDEKINELIYENTCREKILNYAIKNCEFKNMREDCENKVASGLVNKIEAEKILKVL